MSTAQPESGSGPSPSSSSSSSKPTGAQASIFAKRFPRLHARYSHYAASRFGRVAATAWARKRPILIGLAVGYGAINYAVMRREAYLRDYIHPDSWLVLKVYPGAIVECKSAPSLAQLLNSPTPGEDLPRVMELFELCRALKWAQSDERIKGIFADFSGLHVPSSVAPAPLGLAQIEELVETLHEFKIAKKEQRRLQKAAKIEEISTDLVEASGEGQSSSPDTKENEGGKERGEQDSSNEKVDATKEIEQAISSNTKKMPDADDEPVTIAWADSFDSQGSFLLASAFDKVFVQPTGMIPLTGTRMEIPFIKRALDWLGIKVHAEARRDYKSMVSTFVQADGLPPAQLEDEARLLGELSRSVAHAVGVNRFPKLEPDEAADKVAGLARRGPFTAQEAMEAGLISGVKYKREVVKMLGEEPKLRSVASYSRVTDRVLDETLNEDERLDIAVVYLLGTISNAPGEFSASQAIKGLREAGEDPDITSIVLRIDSGGGDAIASDSIWDAVRRVQEDYKKPVIASFGNISASGGYYASACADAILACESTITGSIGVASLRPTFTEKFFDRIGVRFQTIFSGSNAMSVYHELDGQGRKQHAEHIDQTYAGFIDKVCTGRSIAKDVIEELAGGRVWTGLAAWVRCNPDKELVREAEEVGQSQEEGKQAKPKAPVKVVSLATDWKAVDVTKKGEMSTYRIDSVAVEGPAQERVQATRQPSAPGEDDEDALAKAFIEEVETQLDSGEHKTTAEPARKTGDKDVGAALDDESKLAMAAHQAAEASHTGNNHDGSTEEDGVTEEKEEDEEVQLGPYGRGLVDSIGGIWDATYLAISMAVQREIDELVKGGMTLEQASVAVRPGAKREVGADGVMSMGTDLRLVRYPKEKTFRERFREMNRKGDQPALSVFLPAGLSNVGVQIKEYVADLAVQLIVRSWTDPALVQKLTASVEREQKMKMEHASHVRY